MVLLAFPLGWLMVAVPLHALLLKFLLFQLHKSIGLAVFMLVVARLAVRARTGRPDWDAGLPPWQQRLAAAMHVLLYVMVLVTPTLGYLTAATAPARVPTLFLGIIPVPHLLGPDPALFSVLRQVHRGAAILLVVLAGGHALAALHNHRHGRASLRRMWGRRSLPLGSAPAPGTGPGVRPDGL